MKHLSRYIVMAGMALPALDSTPVLGQTRVAVQAGMSRATVSDVGISGLPLELEPRTGPSLGLSGTIPLQGRFSFRIDGTYTRKGFRLTVPDFGLGEEYKVEANFDYIELSGLGLAHLTPSGASKSVYALAGPSVAFNVACGMMQPEQTSQECDDSFRAVDVGTTGGIGVEVPFSEQMTVSVDMRYTLGLTAIFDDPDDGSDDGSDVKNRNLVLQVGVSFPIGE